MPSADVETVIARANESVDLLPTQEESTIIGSDSISHFVEIGHDFIGYLVDIARITPDSKILEIGSGIGRIFIPLTRYLSGKGSFDGVEPIERFVTASTERVTTKFPNFQFHFVDFSNDFYNPKGAVDPAKYRFQWPDASFDCVILVSVFTHVKTPVLENYLSEIARMLKPGGVLFATAFLLDHDVKRRMPTFKHGLNFAHRMGKMQVVDTTKPEGALAYEEKHFAQLAKKRGFIDFNLHRGSWTEPSKPSYGGFQDLVICRKKG